MTRIVDTASSSLVIRPAYDKQDLDEIRRLFREYATMLDFPLCLQDFDVEVAGLPGAYAPPEGRLYLAFYDQQAAGCVAMRNLRPGTCEVKRLYVRPEFRGKGVGRALMERLIAEARAAGNTRMVLDTIGALAQAIQLYRSMGFRDIEPYRDYGTAQVMAMELDLAQADP